MLAIGVAAVLWSRERRLRRGMGGRPGIPTLLVVGLPPVLFFLALTQIETEVLGRILLSYFVLGALGALGALPILAVNALALAYRRQGDLGTEQGRSAHEAATIVTAAAIVFFGGALATTYVYLRSGGVNLC